MEKVFRQRDAGIGSGKAAGTLPSGKEYGQGIDDVSFIIIDDEQLLQFSQNQEYFEIWDFQF